MREENDQNESLVNDLTNFSNLSVSRNISMTSSNSNNSIIYENLFAFGTTNARSISAKIDSLIESMHENNLNLMCVSETWLKDSKITRDNIADLEEAHRVSFVVKNRASRGGGVAICFDMNKMSLKVVRTPTRFEYVCASGQTRGTKRPVFVLSFYMPPSMNADSSKEMISEMEDAIAKAKDRLNDPIVIVAGDANKKLGPDAFLDFPDLELVQTGPTRNTASLLTCHTNCGTTMKEVYVSAPLQSDDGVNSDHRTIVCKNDLPRRDDFTKKTFEFRPYSEAGEKRFGNLITLTDWTCIETGESTSSADIFASILSNYTDLCFPKKKRTVKSSDLPWISARFLRKVRQRRRCYRREKRSPRWKRLKEASDKILLEDKVAFLARIENKVQESGSSRAFFKAVSRLKHRNAPKEWSIRELYPGMDDEKIAEEVAAFFNNISQEYRPLPEPPSNAASSYRSIEPYMISARLKAMKKPVSRLRGDIDPRLNNKFHDLLALPLTYIFSTIRSTCVWPDLWKLERVTIIPKNSCPSGPNELRNLSCTPLYSKLLESFVLEDLKREVKLSESQYGGLKGCGVDHFLVDSWNLILSNLEDNRAGTNIVSIDFEKAFNRMDHNHCIQDLKQKGASRGLLGMISAFLYNRKMSVQVGDSASSPRTVPGGSPQGSILASYLFCVSVDKLSEAASAAMLIASPPRRNIPPIGAELATSTPVRPDLNDDSDLDESFRFFRMRRPFTVDSSEEEESFRMTQDEINSELGPLDRWIDMPVDVKCYIDDFNNIEKVQVQGSVSHITSRRKKTLVHAPKSENLFVNVTREASAKNMVVNAKKTQMLCISSSQDDVRSYMNVENKRLVSGDSLKILGFTFGRRPTVHEHVNCLLSRLRRRLWAVSNLKFSGMKTGGLLKIYFSLVRSVADFASPAYHTLLTQEQSTMLERIQMRALKTIFGYDVSYRTILEGHSIPTLHQRRETLLENFAVKASRNERFASRWFPPAHATGHETRSRNKFAEFTAKTERMARNPVFVMRKILNRIHQKD